MLISPSSPCPAKKPDGRFHRTMLMGMVGTRPMNLKALMKMGGRLEEGVS